MSIRYFLKSFNIVSYLLLVLILIQLGSFIWSIGHGFDFTDEAYSYLALRNPGEVRKTVTFYTHIYNLSFGWLEVSIISVRVVRLFLLLFCSVLFSLGLTNWLKRTVVLDNTAGLNLSLFIIIGSMLINANGSQSLTYNLFSTFLFQLIIGGFLFRFQRNSEMNRWDILVYYILGALLFALFAVKFINAVLLVFPLFFLLFFDKRSIKICLIYFSTMIVGALTMGFLIARSSFFSWITDYMEALNTLGNNTGASILTRYLEDFQYVKTSLLLPNIGFIILVILGVSLNYFLQNKLIKISLAVLIAGSLIFFTYTNGFYLGGQPYFYVYTFLYIAIIIILLFSDWIMKMIAFMQKKLIHLSQIFVILLLVAIPFFGAIGTGNMLSIQIIWYMSFWFAAIYILLISYGQAMLNALMIVLAVNATIQGISGIILYPYRTSPLQEESYSIKDATDENVRVRLSLKNSIDSVQNLIHSKTNFAKGDPIFSFTAEYGFIYLLKGTLPGWGWYSDEISEISRIKLKNSQVKNLSQTIFILPANYQADSTFRSSFRDINVDFPDNYSKLGEVSYSILGNDRPLAIYAPKNILKE